VKYAQLKLATKRGASVARILCIDDDTVSLTIVRQTLQKRGHEVVTATTAPEGLRMIRSLYTDVVICDLMMPGMNGFDFCREKQKFELTKNITTIILTSKQGPITEQSTTEMGAYLLLKPVDKDRLLTLVEQADKQTNSLREFQLSTAL